MGSSKKSSLKHSLSKLQARKYKDQLEKSKSAVKADKLKSSLKKNKSKNSVKSKDNNQLSTTQAVPRIIPFLPTDTILLIGEGNFSFARALFISDLAEIQHLPPANVTATTYDSEEVCYEKYPDARDIVIDLRKRGVHVIFGVDATTMNSRKGFKNRKWKRIVWNFPHAGKQIADQDRNILSNQILILDFLRCVADLLQDGVIPSIQTRRKRKDRLGQGSEDESEGEEIEDATNRSSQMQERGTILITLKNAPPYTLWNLPSLAKRPSMVHHVGSKHHSSPQPRYLQLRSFRFMPEIWKGYSHRMTKGWVEGIHRGSADGVEDRTWEFCLAD